MLLTALIRQGIDALVVTKVANVTYLTGFLGDDSWAMVTRQRKYLLTDSRYTEQANKECINCIVVERKESLPKTAAKILDKLKSVKTVGVEDSASLAAFSALRKEIKGRVKKVSDIVEKLREIKDEGEVENIKKAVDIAHKAFAATIKLVKTGISEMELVGLLNLNIRRMGGRESFETIVAFGANASQPHHLSGQRKLRRNDTVLIDWGVKCRGYCCDLTRSFAVMGGIPCRGDRRSPSSAWPRVFGGWHGQKRSVAMLFTKVYNAVLEAQQAAIAKVRDGATIAEVDSAARNVLKKYKLPVYGHGTGHGLGLEVHEKPVVSAKIKGKLRAGQVITIEPAVYMPGILGVRIEDDVLVTKDGCRVLSQQSRPDERRGRK